MLASEESRLTSGDGEEEHGEAEALAAGRKVVEHLRDARGEVQHAGHVPEHLRLPLELDAAGRALGDLDVVVLVEEVGDPPDGEDEAHEEGPEEVGGEEGLDSLGLLELDEGLALTVGLTALAAEVAVVVDLVEEDNVAEVVLGSARPGAERGGAKVGGEVVACHCQARSNGGGRRGAARWSAETAETGGNRISRDLAR